MSSAEPGDSTPRATDPVPAANPRADARGRSPNLPVDAYRARLPVAFLLSLLVHGLLFSLTLSGDGFGLPGFGFPWQQRRIETPDLRVGLVAAQIPAEPSAEPPAGSHIETPTSVPPQPVRAAGGDAGSLTVMPALPAAPACWSATTPATRLR